MVFDHGQPIEALLPIGGSSTLLLCLGGTEMRLFDLLKGSSTPLHRMLNVHGKAVTCAARGLDKKDAPVVMTGGLDGRVKVHSMDNWEVVQSLAVGGQVLAVDMARDGSRFAVGTNNGVVDIRVRPKDFLSSDEEMLAASDQPFAPVTQDDNDDADDGEDDAGPLDIAKMKFGIPRARSQASSGPRPGTFRYFMRGKGEKPGNSDILAIEKGRKRRRLPLHDQMLQKFRFGEALDAAFRSRDASVIAAVLEELLFRNALKGAANSGQGRAESILHFASKHLSNPRHAELLIEVVHTIVDECEAQSGPLYTAEAREALGELRSRVNDEIEAQRQLTSMLGIVEMAVFASRKAYS